MKQINIKISEEQLKKIDHIAKSKGKSRSQHMIDSSISENEENKENKDVYNILKDHVEELREQIKVKDEQLERKDILLKQTLDNNNNLLLELDVEKNKKWWEKIFK